MTSDKAEVAGAADEPARPVLRIVRGEPSTEELAVLTAVVTAGSDDTGSADAAPATVRGRWNDPAHSIRRYWPTGSGGWRSAR
jgi:hypothetical protein